MRTSVVICTYAPDLYPDLQDAIQSVLDQTYDEVEVVVVVDGNDDLCGRVRDDYGDQERVKVHCNEENRGLSASRNAGIETATGEFIAFMDDDAVADEEWVETLVQTYEKQDVDGVGGKMTPLWVAGKPSFLPEEFYWLVGVTHRGFPDEGPVRNTFGSNISFRNDVLEQLDGFDESLGRKGDKHVQGEETELAARMRAELDGTFYYTPDAEVAHKVFEYRTQFPWLLKRAFWQGYSKAVMATLLPDTGGNETAFLGQLLAQFIPERLWGLVRSPAFHKVSQLVALVLFTAAVGFGYLYGRAMTRG